MNVCEYTVWLFRYVSRLSRRFRMVQPVVEDADENGAFMCSRKCTLVIYFFEIVWQIQITVKNIVEMHNSLWKQVKYIVQITYNVF